MSTCNNCFDKRFVVDNERSFDILYYLEVKTERKFIEKYEIWLKGWNLSIEK